MFCECSSRWFDGVKFVLECVYVLIVCVVCLCSVSVG